MAVRPETLETPERDMHLMTRAPLVAEPDAVDVQAELARRVEAARKMDPPPDVGCRDCWHRGREAALGLIAGGTEAGDVLARLETARELRPTGSQLHWLACWVSGRDAAIEAIEGE